MNNSHQQLHFEIHLKKFSRVQQSLVHCAARMNKSGFGINTAWHGKLLEIGNSISYFVPYKDKAYRELLL